MGVEAFAECGDHLVVVPVTAQASGMGIETEVTCVDGSHRERDDLVGLGNQILDVGLIWPSWPSGMVLVWKGVSAAIGNCPPQRVLFRGGRDHIATT